MPSADNTRLIMNPKAREHLEILRRYAEAKGVDLTYKTHFGRVARASDSALVRYGLEIAAGTVAQSVGAERLKAARSKAGVGQSALAKLLGYEHRSSVGNVEIGRAPLEGALLAWVTTQEQAAK